MYICSLLSMDSKFLCVLNTSIEYIIPKFHLYRSFRWDRGGVPVLQTSGGRVSVRQGSLTIGQTWSGDIGDYTCTVTSQAGNDSRTTRLEVMWVQKNHADLFWLCLLIFVCYFPLTHDLTNMACCFFREPVCYQASWCLLFPVFVLS